MLDGHATKSLLPPLLLAIGVALGAARSLRVSAHEGPPFPILMDKTVAGHVVSVWADPDIGEARFFIVLEPGTRGPPRATPEVSMWVEPASGRLQRANYQARQQALRNQLQFEATPHFDQRDLWTVGFRFATPNGRTEELITQVESTPPGYGPWDLAIYLFPFVFLAGMWVIAMLRRRRMRARPPQTDEPGDPCSRRPRLPRHWPRDGCGGGKTVSIWKAL